MMNFHCKKRIEKTVRNRKSNVGKVLALVRVRKQILSYTIIPTIYTRSISWKSFFKGKFMISIKTLNVHTVPFLGLYPR